MGRDNKEGIPALPKGVPQWITIRHKYLVEAYKEGNGIIHLSDIRRRLKEEGLTDSAVNKFIRTLVEADYLERIGPGMYRVKEQGEKSEHMQADKIIYNMLEYARGSLDQDLTIAMLTLLYLRVADEMWKRSYREQLMLLQNPSDPEILEVAAELATPKLPKDVLHRGEHGEYTGFWDYIVENPAETIQRIINVLQALGERADNESLRTALEKPKSIFRTYKDNQVKEPIIHDLVLYLSEQDFSRIDQEEFVHGIGLGYEKILEYAFQEKAKGGEQYTPRSVVRLLVRLLNPKPGEIVYDPAAGSGGMLIEAYEYVRRTHGENGAKTVAVYGQDWSDVAHTIGTLNIYLHGIPNFEYWYGDTLLQPKSPTDRLTNIYDVVLANPPWNVSKYPPKRIETEAVAWKERYPFGLPSKQSADWLWIQHMLTSAKENGRVGVVIDNGALFRGGTEADIRKAVVERDWVEAVILLPKKQIFYNTMSQGVIVIFNKNKPPERRGKILFINAGGDEFVEVEPNSRKKLYRLTEEAIRKIVEVYREFKEIPEFSRVVSVEEVARNEYSLNVSRYVAPKVRIEVVPIRDAVREAEIKEHEAHTAAKEALLIAKHIAEAKPFSELPDELQKIVLEGRGE